MTVAVAAERLWFDEPLSGFDLETTAADPREARIVTWSLVNVDSTGRYILNSRGGMVDPGIPIPDGAAAVHGITTERARAEGGDPRQALETIFDALDLLASARLPVIAYNAAYDLTVIWHEAQRHDLVARAAVITDGLMVVDPLVLDKGVDKYRRGSRRLADTCAYYRVELPGGVTSWHDSTADALAATLLAKRLTQAYTALALPIDELHALQRRWAAAQAASLKDYFLRTGKTDAAETVDGAWPVRTP